MAIWVKIGQVPHAGEMAISIKWSSKRHGWLSQRIKGNFSTIIDRKIVLPSKHLDIGALRLPTLAQNQAGDWLMLS